MKLLVSGSRYLTDFAVIEAALRKSWFDEMVFDELIHGAAKGVDSMFAAWGRREGMKVTPFPANWNKHGDSAGHIRNQEMMDYALQFAPDVRFLAVWDGRRVKSGTYNMIKLANTNRLKGYVHQYDP